MATATKYNLKVTIVSANGTRMPIDEFCSCTRNIDLSIEINRQAIENYIRLTNPKYDKRQIVNFRKKQLEEQEKELIEKLNLIEEEKDKLNSDTLQDKKE